MGLIQFIQSVLQNKLIEVNEGNEDEYTRTQNIINIGNISTSIPASYFNDRKLYACLRF